MIIMRAWLILCGLSLAAGVLGVVAETRPHLDLYAPSTSEACLWVPWSTRGASPSSAEECLLCCETATVCLPDQSCFRVTKCRALGWRLSGPVSFRSASR